MAVNKVIYAGDTLIDLTQDTVTPEDVKTGVTFHQANGQLATGTYVDEKELFWCEYDVTTFDDITQALDDGKLPVLSFGQYICEFGRIIPDVQVSFINIDALHNLRVITCLYNDVWSINDIHGVKIETQSNKDLTTVTANKNNYPSSMAVYQALAAKQNKLTAGDNITIDENNVISASGGSGSSYTFTNGLTETDGTVSWDLNDEVVKINSNQNIGIEIGNSGSSVESGASQNVALAAYYPSIGWTNNVTKRNVITGFNNIVGKNYNQSNATTNNFIGGSSCAINSSSFKKGEGAGVATNSIVFGEGLLSCSNGQAVFGTYNLKDVLDDYILIIGNGTSSARSNALTVSKTGIVECTNIPAPPTSDGNYVLKCSIVNGNATYSWVAE